MPNEPLKITKIDTTLLLFYVDTWKNLKAIRGNGYRFVPKVARSLPKTILLVVRSIYPNLPQMGQNLYHDMLMPLHDCMPSFMNFRRVLDLLEFKNQASEGFVGNQQCPGVWISFPSLAWDLEIHPRTHTCDFSTNFGALEQVLVVQFWIMHIKCPELQLMYKKVQTNPQ